MTLEVRGIKYVLQAETQGAEVGIKRAEAALGKAGDAADRGATAFLKFGKQGQITAQQMQALGYQTTDIVTQLASGQSPFLVLLQQGGQLRDQFGSFGNLFKAVGMQVASVGGAFAVGAAALGGLAYTALQGAKELTEFNKGLALTGNAAGLTRGDLELLSRDIQQFSGGTIGNAREAVTQLGASGAFTRESIDAVGRAAMVMQRVTGDSLDSIIKRFAGARDGVTQWAIAANKTYNYLSGAQLENIRLAEQQGRTQEALRANFAGLGDTLKERVIPQLGIVETLWASIGRLASQAADNVKSVGRPDSLEQQLEILGQRIRKVQEEPRDLRSLYSSDRARAARIAELEWQRKSVEDQLVLQRLGADESAKAAAKSRADTARQTNAYLEAMLGEERAGQQKFLAQRQAGYAELLGLSQRYYALEEINAGEYRDNVIAVERARVDAERRDLLAARSVESRRPTDPEKPEQKVAQHTRLIAIDTQLVNLAAKRAQLERDIRDGRVGVPPGTPGGSTEAQLFADMQRHGQAVAQERVKAMADLQNANRELAISLIADDRARGQAVIAEEERQRREQLSLAVASAYERRAIEDELATWRSNREKLLTDQLKPEWQRQLDLIADGARHTREAFNNAMNSSARTAEDVWVDMVAHGQNSFKRLVNVINEELARIAWQKYLAKPWADFLGSMFGIFLGAPDTGGAIPGGVGAQPYHTGGIVGQGGGTPRSIAPQLLAGARRYHGGGLAAGEVPAILMRGEEVVTRGDPRHRANGGRGGGPTIVQNIVYQVPAGMSPAAYAAALQEHQRQVKAETIADALRPGTPLNLAIRGAVR